MSLRKAHSYAHPFGAELPNPKCATCAAIEDVEMREAAREMKLRLAVEALQSIKGSRSFPGNGCTTGYHDTCGGCLEMWAEKALHDMGEEDWERPEPGA